jgi:TRAP-type C4-dicarboxylate transport system substrate-binding protein
MGVSNTAIYCQYVDDYSVLDLCYLFEDIDHVRNFMNSDIAASLMGKMEEADTGISILSFNYLGSKNVAANRPIQSLDDIKGLSMRCSTGEYYLKSFTAFGAAPQSISSSEVMASLSQGIIDGVEQSSAIIYAANYLEYVPYITHTGHIIQMFSVNINTELYRSLTEDLQTLRKEACIQVSTELFDVSEEMQVAAEVAMAETGITFYDIDKTEWIEAMQPVYEEFNSRFGSELVDGIKALKD